MGRISPTDEFSKTIELAAHYFQMAGELHSFHKLNIQNWLIGTLPENAKFKATIVGKATATKIKVDKKGNKTRQLRNLIIRIKIETDDKIPNKTRQDLLFRLENWLPMLVKTRVELSISINGILIKGPSVTKGKKNESTGKISRKSPKSTNGRRKARAQ